MTRSDFLKELNAYKSMYEEEQDFVPLFVELLSLSNCFDRSLLTGHLTASAWILNARQEVLLLHHKKLDKWLQPGGHADGDENLIRVARKEAEEETGLHHLEMIGNSFFDLDIHFIPERKGIVGHYHYDVRYAFFTNSPDQIQKNHESHDLKWVLLSEVVKLACQEQSFIRMTGKTEKLHTQISKKVL